MKNTYLAAMALLLSPMAANAVLISSYDFNSNGDLSDSLGVGPDLVAEGGIFSAGFYFFFGANQGLILDGGLPDNANYEIEMRIVLAGNETGWRKLIDFQDLSADEGLYINPADRLAFWTGAIGGGADSFGGEAFFIISLTRNGLTNEVQGFLDGVL